MEKMLGLFGRRKTSANSNTAQPPQQHPVYYGLPVQFLRTGVRFAGSSICYFFNQLTSIGLSVCAWHWGTESLHMRPHAAGLAAKELSFQDREADTYTPTSRPCSRDGDIKTDRA